jgi:ribosomal protein L11 methyltransferase
VSEAQEPAVIAISLVVDAQYATHMEAALWELSPGGAQEAEEQPDGHAAYVVYAEEAARNRLLAGITERDIPLAAPATVTSVASDWSERWKAFHTAVVIGDLWVGPPWQSGDVPRHLKPVVIEPAQGFGTGAHPTTRLVLSLLQEQPVASLLDVGCGSGVLAIAAARLGFAPIIAVDNDPLAVESTLDNLARNQVSGVDVRLVDAVADPLPAADIMLANVLLEPLVQLAPRATAPRVVLSGLLRSQGDPCAEAWQQAGYVVRERRDRDGWCALVLDDARDTARSMQHRAVW